MRSCERPFERGRHRLDLAFHLIAQPAVELAETIERPVKTSDLVADIEEFRR